MLVLFEQIKVMNFEIKHIFFNPFKDSLNIKQIRYYI